MAEERVQRKSAGQQELRYPRLYRRIQAAIIDGIIVMVTFFGAAMILASYDIHAGFKFSGVAILIIIIEPGLVSITGGTIGHHLRGCIRSSEIVSRRLLVRRAHQSRNIGRLASRALVQLKVLF